MSVEIACPHCSTRIKAPESALGRTVRCPKCKNQFVATAIGSQPVVTLSETDLAALPDSRSASPFDFDAVATTPTVAAAAATAATRGSTASPPARPQPVPPPAPVPAPPPLPVPAPTPGDAASDFDFDMPASTPVAPTPTGKRAAAPSPATSFAPVDEVEAPVLPSKPKSLPTRHGAVTGVPGLSQLIMYRFVGLFYWGYAILCGLGLIAATAASIVLYKSPAMAAGVFIGGLFVYVVQLVALRCVVELVVVLFKMYDTLLELRDLNQQLLKR
jgi:predicted Zn finger-like uncharacterized protein